MVGDWTFYAAGTAVAVPMLGAAYNRLRLSRAKHRSLAGHARMSRRVARLLPHYEFTGEAFFHADDAPAPIGALRRAGFERLQQSFDAKFPRASALGASLHDGLSDLQFTSVYRVPFPFSRQVRTHLRTGSFMASSAGVRLTDVDGNEFIDLSGSYGVNVFGYDFYKQCIAEGSQTAASLGPVLGAYHPVVVANVERLRRISGMDEVSFHMSGTEAVMQAVRLARYHTGRSHLVRFCGAYHGWWDDVQPGVGTPIAPRATYTLADMDDASLKVLERRRNIACVLVNPIQALHPNKNAPGDSALVDSARAAHYDRKAYSQWLRKLREVCDRRGIVLILDEVFVGFRLDPGGAQAYFDVRADLVTYGKTLGGGLPVGVLCGGHELMRRFRADRPADICFARGTFNAHPYVMGAMNAFLSKLDTPQVRQAYVGLDERWNARASALNDRLDAEGLPVRVANLSTIWTILYSHPSRYNWMFQFYLRDEGLALSWVGSGRLIFTIDFDESEFRLVVDRFVRAARRMSDDGWWWHDGSTTDRDIRRRMLREMLATLNPVGRAASDR